MEARAASSYQLPEVVIRRLLVERMDISGDRDTTRISAALLVGGCFLLVLHGTGSAFVLAYAGLFYTLGRLLAGGAFCIPMVWLAAAVCIAVADHRILPEDSMHFGSLLGPSAAFLDAAPFTGVYHWSHSIKLMLLRSMSFVLDWHWALSSGARQSVFLMRVSTCLLCCSAGRPGEGRYTFLNSLTHLLYAPTFLAGRWDIGSWPKTSRHTTNVRLTSQVRSLPSTISWTSAALQNLQGVAWFGLMSCKVRATMAGFDFWDVGGLRVCTLRASKVSLAVSHCSGHGSSQARKSAL